MLFSSPIFLFVFLPLVLGLHYLAPKKFKNTLLFLSSLFFYAWGEQKMVFLILLSTVIDYLAGLIIDKGYKKIGLYLSIIFNISVLGYFKYSYFLLENITTLQSVFDFHIVSLDSFPSIVLPIGISFYTFQTMSYTIDVYRGNIKANKNFIDFGCYVSLFPQLIAGPIVKYKDVSEQLINRSFSSNQFVEGIERFIIGLAKKMIIANNCAFLADGIFLLPESELGMLAAWIGAIIFCLQLYFDFSGYSDMAIGLGKMLGFNFLENFNYPYVSRSVQEFWRRWHISLSSWFRDYLYIPLGGNRLSKTRTYINILVVFLITGIWHGASWNFIVWGVIHGIFIALELKFLKAFLQKNVFISRLYLLLFVIITFVIFRSETLDYAVQFIAKMFSFNFYVNTEHLNFYFTKEVIFASILAIIFSTPIYKQSLRPTLIRRGVLYPSIFILFGIAIIYVSLDTYNPFIYFRF